MARSSKGLQSGILISGDNTIYTSPTSTVTTLTILVLTNTGTSQKTVSLYINRGTSMILDTVYVPPGRGSNISVLNGIVLNAGDTLTINASSGDINYDLSGWVIT